MKNLHSLIIFISSLFLFSFCNSSETDYKIPLKVTGTLIQHDSIPAEGVKMRPVSVWLPPSYENSTESYPVLYFNDGQNLFDPTTSFIGVDWALDEWADSLMKTKKISEFIIVGIWNTEDRGAEFFPEKAVEYMSEEDLDNVIKRYGKIEQLADEYLSFVTQSVKPFIDQQYRTKPEFENTAIGGSSMGGLISLYALSEYPNVFSTALCVSTHWPIGNGITLDYFKDHVPMAGKHKIYFDHGTETLDSLYAPYQKRMDDIMKQKGYESGVNWKTLVFEGHEHSERAWRNRVDKFFTFAYGRGIFK